MTNFTDKELNTLSYSLSSTYYFLEERGEEQDVLNELISLYSKINEGETL